MKITKYHLVMLVVVVLAASLAWLTFTPAQPQQPTVASKNKTDAKLAATEEHRPLQYKVTIESSVQDTKQTVLTHSVLSWTMVMQQSTEAQHYVGRLDGISFKENNRPSKLPTQLPFTVHYNGHQFENVDLLGLSEEHVLQVVKQVLGLMSYSERTQLTYEDALQRKVFAYARKGQKVTRTATQTDYVHAQQKPQQEEEKWELSLANNGQVERLDYTNTRLWQQQSQQYQIIQDVTVVPSQQNINLANISVNSHTNAHLVASNQQVKTQLVITNEQELLNAIEQLKASLDPDLAKIVGEYLHLNYTAYEIAEMLSDMPTSNSAIIYALQKNQSPEAEQMLADLLNTSVVSDMNKHRVAIALGRFGASSDIGFSALTELSKTSNQAASTALLSIGSMAYFTPEKSASVSELLTSNLAQGESLATTVLAVANSRDEQLIKQLPPLLNNPDEAVKLNAIKVLTKQGSYQDAVVNTVVANPKSKFVDAFVRSFTESQQTLTKANETRLKQVVETSDNPIVVNKLTTLLSSTS
ncbi:HEAT repeat domain-containing protein (plasmid) [Pseudoalteromonas sp. T1lg65]|uniref:HEAT repeat domain-containing protein n=1 Tax=Pseudoalteromonas sp. T1lg65 TaxID=2077101 RepID=UPI003F7952D2